MKLESNNFGECGVSCKSSESGNFDDFGDLVIF